MPRAARKRSESGYYHVLIRGIGKQNIFEDDEDRQRFIDTMKRYKKELKFEIHAYCIMGNHVHLLIKDIDDKLDLILKKIEGSYAYFFNWKYERVGHLFQDRFKSEVVDNDKYYLTVLRYIHQNPVKAGLSKIEEYRWSSYSEYISSCGITDTGFALDLLGSKEKYIEFMNESSDTKCLEIINTNRMTDENATAIIRKKYKIKNAQVIQKLPIEQRNQLLHQIKEDGLSIRQISRLTGINRGIVLKA